MKADREAISKFVYQLQNQKIVPAWTLSSEEAIYSVAVGKAVAWGPRASRLRSLLTLADKLMLADLLLLLMGSWVATKLWWKVRKDARGRLGVRRIDRVFAGFGANSEEKLWERYCNMPGMPPLRINQSSCEGMSCIGRPNLFSIYRVLVREVLGYSAKLRLLISVPAQNRPDFMTACGMNAGIYAFNKEYWEMARDSCVTEVTFLAADIPAFACVDAGMATTYLQHGLISLTNLMPRFSKIEVLTSDEEKYLKCVYGDVDISRVAGDDRITGAKRNAMLLLSVDDTQGRLITAKRLIDWANKTGVSVTVRPVPSLREDALTRLRSHLPGVCFDADSLSMEDSIVRYNPKFIVAWTSSALATALSYGCIPVSLCDPDEHDGINNMIYPMQHRALFWPRDEHIMNMVVSTEKKLFDNIRRLREYRDSAFDWFFRAEKCSG